MSINGKELRDLRNDQGWTQEELAIKLGHSTRGIQLWEKDGVPVSKVPLVRDLFNRYANNAPSIASEPSGPYGKYGSEDGFRLLDLIQSEEVDSSKRKHWRIYGCG